MFRRVLLVIVPVALLTGCVPVTEPVGDITKAEPDKALVGNWNTTGAQKDELKVDVPAVKGNPKGLMRALNASDSALWFFTHTVGKHSYANIVLDVKNGLDSPPFHKEGEFEKWQKEPKKRYFIFRYKIDGDKLTVDGGSKSAFEKLMDAEKFKETDSGCFETPAGWLVKYWEKNDPNKIFDGSNTQEYKRAKK